MPPNEIVYNTLRNPMDIMPCHPNGLPINNSANPANNKLSLLPSHYRESNQAGASGFLNGRHLRPPINNPSLIRLNSSFIPSRQQQQYQGDMIRTPPRHEYSSGPVPAVTSGLRITNPNMAMPAWLTHIKANGANMAALANVNNHFQSGRNHINDNSNISSVKSDQDKMSKSSTARTTPDTTNHEDNKVDINSNTDSDNCSSPSSSLSDQDEIKTKKRKLESPVTKSLWRPY